VVTQAVCHDVGLAEVATRAADGRFVVAKKQVDAGSLGFLPPEQISQVRSAGRQDMSRPIRDLCGSQAARSPVDEEQLDLLAAHAVIISQDRDTGPIAKPLTNAPRHCQAARGHLRQERSARCATKRQ